MIYKYNRTLMTRTLIIQLIFFTYLLLLIIYLTGFERSFVLSLRSPGRSRKRKFWSSGQSV